MYCVLVHSYYKTRNDIYAPARSGSPTSPSEKEDAGVQIGSSDNEGKAPIGPLNGEERVWIGMDSFQATLY